MGGTEVNTSIPLERKINKFRLKKGVRINEEAIIHAHTECLSVVTAEMTNMRTKVMKISSTSDCTSLPDGNVAPPNAMGGKIMLSANDAANAPVHWTATYMSTWLHGKCLVSADAMVTAGFM